MSFEKYISDVNNMILELNNIKCGLRDSIERSGMQHVRYDIEMSPGSSGATDIGDFASITSHLMTSSTGCINSTLRGLAKHKHDDEEELNSIKQDSEYFSKTVVPEFLQILSDTLNGGEVKQSNDTDKIKELLDFIGDKFTKIANLTEIQINDLGKPSRHK